MSGPMDGQISKSGGVGQQKSYGIEAPAQHAHAHAHAGKDENFAAPAITRTTGKTTPKGNR